MNRCVLLLFYQEGKVVKTDYSNESSKFELLLIRETIFGLVHLSLDRMIEFQRLGHLDKAEEIIGRLYRESEVAATGIGEVSLLAPPKTWYGAGLIAWHWNTWSAMAKFAWPKTENGINCRRKPESRINREGASAVGIVSWPAHRAAA